MPASRRDAIARMGTLVLLLGAARIASGATIVAVRVWPASDYRAVRGLSIEVQQKLNKHRPETIGQAQRISGITPAAVSLLLVHLKRGIGAARDDAASQRAAGSRV